MSLDVYLDIAAPITKPAGSGIFIRDGGQTRQVTVEEWNRLHPDMPAVECEPEDYETTTVYSANITHNLNSMASEAGIYEHLWRPDEIGVTKAAQLIEPLERGLALLKSDRARFEKFNAPNGWGLYEHFVPFVAGYLDACKEHPDAAVRVWR